MTEFLYNFSLWGNSGLDLIKALGILLGILLLLKVFREIVLARLGSLSSKTKTDVDDTLIEIISRIKLITYIVVALFFALKSLILSVILDKILIAVLILVLLFEASRAIESVLDYAIRKHIKSGKEISDEELKLQSKSVGGIFRLLTRIIVWSLGFIFLLQNLGVEVTSLIAGLGIGGIAVALALQSVLGDLFSAIAIYLDKPFEIGDFIIVGDFVGTVEKVGIKSTRVRSLSGEQVIFANNDLLGARVRNFKRLYERRVVFSIGVTYQTPSQQIELIPTWIKEIVNKEENVRFDRTHFKSFGPSSLDFEIVYFVTVSDYNLYMDIQERINLGIMKKFEKEKVDFAYPTQMIFLEK